MSLTQVIKTIIYTFLVQKQKNYLSMIMFISIVSKLINCGKHIFSTLIEKS